MYNNHVMKYYRWLGWVKGQQNKLLGSAMYYGFAWNELVKQSAYETEDL